jgi:hypothetical protein
MFAPVKEEFAPDRPDYDFNPRPMNPFPPYQWHEFYHRFYACYTSGTYLHWFHRCRRPELAPFEFHRLPRSKEPIDDELNERKEFWGMYARDRVMMYRVVVWNIIALAPTTAFFFVWLFQLGNVDDLQTASVPLTITLGLLSLLWMIVYQDSEVARSNKP